MIVLIVTCMVLCFGFVLKRAMISKDILFGAEQCLQSQSLCFSLCSASKWLRKRSWEGMKPCQLTQWHLGNNTGEKAKWCTGTEKWLESGGGTATLKSIRRNQAERRRRWSRCKIQDSPGAPCRKPCWGSYFPAACGENYTGTDVYYAACGKDHAKASGNAPKELSRTPPRSSLFLKVLSPWWRSTLEEGKKEEKKEAEKNCCGLIAPFVIPLTRFRVEVASENEGIKFSLNKGVVGWWFRFWLCF